MHNVLELFKNNVGIEMISFTLIHFFFFSSYFSPFLFLYYIIESLRVFNRAILERILKCSLNGNLQLTLNRFLFINKYNDSLDRWVMSH